MIKHPDTGKWFLPPGTRLTLSGWALPLYWRWRLGLANPLFADGPPGFVLMGEPMPDGTMKFETITAEEYEAVPHRMFKYTYPEDAAVPGGGLMSAFIIGGDGQKKLGHQERGLVLQSGIERLQDGTIGAGPAVDVGELRSMLFLWDKLDWPQHPLIDVPATAEMDFLIKEDVIFRTIAGGMGRLETRQSVIDVDLAAFEHRAREEPGRWSLGRGESATYEAGAEAETEPGLMVRLHNLVVVPDYNVPLEEVLEFRQKRRPELLALRFEIDAIYQRIVQSPDKQHATIFESEKLVTAIEAQRKVANEAGWKKVMGSLTSKIKLQGVGGGAMAAYEAYEKTGDLTTAALAGVAGIAVTIALGKTKVEKTPSPIDYIISIDRTFGERT